MESERKNGKRWLMDQRIANWFIRFEHLVSILLSALIALVLLFALARIFVVAYHLILSKILEPTAVSYSDFSELFGRIMTVLIIIEFMNSIISVVKNGDLKELVSNVALIAALAICRKLIIYEYDDPNAMKLVSLGVILLAIGIFYFLITNRLKQSAECRMQGSAECRVQSAESLPEDTTLSK